MRRLSFLLCLTAALSCAAAAQNPFFFHSAYEPPAAKDAAALTASTKASPPDLLTTSEKTGWEQTGTYAEVEDLTHRLERQSPMVKVLTFGTSPQGRPMIALVVSKDKAFTPEAAARTNKAVVLIQSGIHSGEIEGKDTALMLVRDMAITKLHANWLDNAIFVVIPVFNLDGHEDRSLFNRANQNGPMEMGTRNTRQNLNLNRDYIKGDTPEMRAWLKLYNTWAPDFMFDNHVTDGADMQYDVTWDMARNQDIAEPVRDWINDKYVPELNKRMEADGHGVAPYGGLGGGRGGAGGGGGRGGRGGRGGARGGDASATAGANDAGAAALQAAPAAVAQNAPAPTREFNMEVFTPRYSHLYTALQDRPCLLVETHSLKTTRTRAWADYDIMRHTLDIITANPQELRTAIRTADASLIAMSGDHNAPPMYLAGRVDTTKSEPLVYRSLKMGSYESPVTGGMVNGYSSEPDNIQTVIHDKIQTTVEAQMPLGYLIPPEWSVLADELRLHNVEMETVPKDITDNFETYRFSGVTFDSAPNEGGRIGVNNLEVKLVTEKITMPANSIWVPMKQRRARLILQMLEPEAPESLVRWGFLNPIMGGGGGGRGGSATPNAYISEPIARRLMADHPELVQQFQQQITSDPVFAADPQARLQWWFEHSQYSPANAGAGRYPVVRVWTKTW